MCSKPEVCVDPRSRSHAVAATFGGAPHRPDADWGNTGARRVSAAVALKARLA